MQNSILVIGFILFLLLIGGMFFSEWFEGYSYHKNRRTLCVRCGHREGLRRGKDNGVGLAGILEFKDGDAVYRFEFVDGYYVGVFG